jgi:hypothetical protein
VIEDRDLFERAVRRFPPPERSFDRLITRRDRKQRNRRIAAGAVGLAIAVAAVLVGTSIVRSDRKQPAHPARPFRHNGAIAIAGDAYGVVSLIDPRTGSRSELTICPECATSGGFVDLAWSPDGTRIAFTTFRDHVPEDLGSGTVGVFDVASNETTTIATCGSRPSGSGSSCIGHLAWSPDGSRIALGVSGRLDLLDPNGRNRTSLADLGDRGSVGRPTWSPDGSSIAFFVSKGGSADLYRIDADGSNLDMVLDPQPRSAWADGPDWSPDGSRIAYTVFVPDPSSEGRMSIPEVWVVDAEGSRPSKLFEAGPCCLGRSTGLAWSPDGTTIAFVGNEPGAAAFDATVHPRLYLIDPDGGGVQVLARDVPLGQPAWQPVP